MVPNLPSTVSGGGGDDGDRGLERNNGEELKITTGLQWFSLLQVLDSWGCCYFWSISRFHF